MVKLAPLLCFLPVAAAWPAVMLTARRAPDKFGRPNTATPPAGFNAENQFVETRAGTAHEYRRPGPDDRRGQCPGLNAAANHGYLPRNGIVSIAETADGLAAAYHMERVQGVALAILSIALSGDIPTLRWSIGGAFPAGLPGLAQPKGILGTHNEYEGDASIISGDAYLNGGKVGIFRQEAWANLMSLGDDGYGFDELARHSLWVTNQSVSTNPYYFSAPLSGFVVAPAAHNFVVVFMSNHSAENPGGYLNRDILKSFFGVSGDTPGQYKFDYGSQRIPDNWYKMPLLNSYTLAQTVGDALLNEAAYPGIAKLGGNTGKTNSFVGLDGANISGGLYNAQSLKDPKNAFCFAMQATMAGKLDQANVIAFLNEQLLPILVDMGCPTADLTKFDLSSLEQYPGYKYQASGYKKIF